MGGSIGSQLFCKSALWLPIDHFEAGLNCNKKLISHFKTLPICSEDYCGHTVYLKLFSLSPLFLK